MTSITPELMLEVMDEPSRGRDGSTMRGEPIYGAITDRLSGSPRHLEPNPASVMDDPLSDVESEPDAGKERQGHVHESAQRTRQRNPNPLTWWQKMVRDDMERCRQALGEVVVIDGEFYEVPIDAGSRRHPVRPAQHDSSSFAAISSRLPVNDGGSK